MGVELGVDMPFKILSIFSPSHNVLVKSTGFLFLLPLFSLSALLILRFFQTPSPRSSSPHPLLLFLKISFFSLMSKMQNNLECGLKKREEMEKLSPKTTKPRWCVFSPVLISLFLQIRFLPSYFVCCRPANFFFVKKEFIFLIDRSDSMKEGGMEEAERLMKVTLSLLPSDVRFNVVGFGGSADYLFVDRY